MQAYISNMFATLTMFFVISLPTRSWRIPGRTMPTNYIALFCVAVFLFAFAYHRADFGFVLSATIQSLSQRAELMRKHFNESFDHINTATNMLKLFYTITSIYFGWCLRLTTPISGKLRLRPTTPISGKLRPSPKLGSNVVEAIRAYAENKQPKLMQYLITSQETSVNDAQEEMPTAITAVHDGATSGSEADMPKLKPSVGGATASISSVNYAESKADMPEVKPSVGGAIASISSGTYAESKADMPEVKPSVGGAIASIPSGQYAESKADMPEVKPSVGGAIASISSGQYAVSKADMPEVKPSVGGAIASISSGQYAESKADMPKVKPSMGGVSTSNLSDNNVTAETSGKAHRLSSMSKKLKQRWVSSLLSHALGCCKTYVTIHLWIILAHNLAGLYSALFAAVPESIFSLALPAICFLGPSLGGIERKLAIYTCLAILCSCVGTFSVILFSINVWLDLHLTYVINRSEHDSTSSEGTAKSKATAGKSEWNKSETPSLVPAGKPQPAVPDDGIEPKSNKEQTKTALPTWVPCRDSATKLWMKLLTFWSSKFMPCLQVVTDFATALVTFLSSKLIPYWHFIIKVCAKSVSWIFLDRTFVAGFCTKLLTYHCDITSLSLTVVMFLTLCQFYGAASMWAHGEDHNDDGNYRFERGDANTQLQFVRHKWRVFLVMFVSAALCTMGQIHTSSPSTVQPETISHVFCKTNKETQLECLVNSTYFNPVEPEVKKCFCDSNSSEWDFCGE